MTADSLLYPQPADLLAWADANPGRVKAEAVEALRVAVNETAAARMAADEAKAALSAAYRLADAAEARCSRAPHAEYRASEPVCAAYAAATLPDAVAAFVAEGWVDVTHAVLGTRGSVKHVVYTTPAPGRFAGLARYAPGEKAVTLRLLTPMHWGMSVDTYALRLGDFGIIGWPRKGAGLLDPKAARAALSIPSPKAKKASR